MSRVWQVPWMIMAGAFVVAMGAEAAITLSEGRTEACALSPNHGGLTFPVEKITSQWTCRLQEVIDNHTIVNTVGPIRTALSESMYRYLLDRPPLAAGLIHRLDLGWYKSESRGPDRFWGDDGEGAKGIVELVYQDSISRIYYLEGSQDSRLLPNLSGKAVVFLRMGSVKDSGGTESMDSTLVSYTKLDNRLLSGVASLLRPLVERMAAGKLRKGVNTVNRLGLVMRRHPERVLSAATNSPAFAAHDVGFLKAALGGSQDPESTGRRNASSP